MGFQVKDITKPRRRLGAKTIVIMKIVAASMLFFGCCVFFFQNTQMFLDDFLDLNPFPIVFFSGIILVCVYITNLVAHIESDELYLADRFDLLYKIIFTITILSMVVRSFLSEPYLNVPVAIVAICIASGVLTLITPRIVDNNNNDF